MKPQCWMCGRDDVELRISEQDPWGGNLSHSCEECFVPQQIGGDGYGGKCCGVMDGPDWDDLERAEQ